ncbi:hypothetical protein FRC09_003974 [Ceratobasidium sp. 395]|nr:hypothetical protein FRC09_003974 [Ceratobasidium sp. 395]
MRGVQQLLKIGIFELRKAARPTLKNDVTRKMASINHSPTTTMSAPLLQPLGVSQPLHTPPQNGPNKPVQAIDPNVSPGLVTDAHGNPTTDHSANAVAVLLILHTS